MCLDYWIPTTPRRENSRAMSTTEIIYVAGINKMQLCETLLRLLDNLFLGNDSGKGEIPDEKKKSS